MPIRIRPFLPAAALALLAFFFAFATPEHTVAQQKDGLLGGNIKYNSGQSVQPIFEGWTKAADGSYQLWFGYLNRNHVEELPIPVGPDNRIEPGGPDRGQPTYFYTRFNRQLFAVTVPANFGPKGQVIWTVRANGQAERAMGWLRADWEIAPPGTGTGTGRAADPNNRPPTLTVSAPPQITITEPLTLTAEVTDDGLPPARPGRGRGGGGAAAAARNRPPAFDNPDFKGSPPINVPQVERPTPPTVTERLQVSWFVWRGPAKVLFEPATVGADQGKAASTVTFSKPGDYVLRARATDGAATTLQDVKVSVASAQP
jgi:hypothetical protein